MACWRYGTCKALEIKRNLRSYRNQHSAPQPCQEQRMHFENPQSQNRRKKLLFFRVSWNIIMIRQPSTPPPFLVAAALVAQRSSALR